MAYDKVIDSVVLETGLTDIANAIRSKGDMTETLSFPNGFINAINEIPAGIELNFEVVGGTEQPGSPSENTIWINTAAEITGWVFSATEPETPTEGMLWIFNASDSSVSFNALKKNEIHLCPLAARQYIGGAWEKKTGKSYQGGEWKDWVTFLYNTGDECIDLTGGWQGRAWKMNSNNDTAVAPTLTKNDDHLFVRYPVSDHDGAIEPKKDIDLTGYTKLSVDVDYYSASNLAMRMRMCIVRRSATYFMTDAVAMTDITGTGTFSIDLTGLTLSGTYDIAIGCRVNDVKAELEISRIYLSKG